MGAWSGRGNWVSTTGGHYVISQRVCCGDVYIPDVENVIKAMKASLKTGTMAERPCQTQIGAQLRSFIFWAQHSLDTAVRKKPELGITQDG